MRRADGQIHPMTLYPSRWEFETFAGERSLFWYVYKNISGPGLVMNAYPYCVRARRDTGPNSSEGLFGHGYTEAEALADAKRQVAEKWV